jgi:hypothetical protein
MQVFRVSKLKLTRHWYSARYFEAIIQPGTPLPHFKKRHLPVMRDALTKKRYGGAILLQTCYNEPRTNKDWENILEIAEVKQ